jgi:hypothetical protein
VTKAFLGVLVDPFTRTVTSVELPGDEDVDAMAKLVDAEFFEAIVLRKPLPDDPGVVLYLDEERADRVHQAFWSFDVNPRLLFAGKGVITAVDVDGLTTWGVSVPEEVAKRVIWRDPGIPQIEEIPDGSVRH